MAVNLTTQNTWYVIATGSEYTTTLSGYTSKWKPQISARWTAVSGSVYTVQYKCSIVKVSGNLMYATSVTNAYKIAGSGATTASGGSNETFTIPSDVKTISGTYDVSNGFNVSISGGIKIQNNGNTGLSGTGVLPGTGTLPATPTCSVNAISGSAIMVHWGTTDLGTPAGTASLYNGTTSNPNSFLYSVNTTGTKIFTNDILNANTEYFYKATASNTAGSVSSAVVSAITYPAGITSVVASNITSTTAKIDITCDASGSSDTTYLQMSTDGTNWVTYSNIPNVHGRTISTLASNLTPDTQYTRYYRVHNSSGNSAVSSVTFRTLKTAHLYGSVNDQTKEINKLYGSVNGQTKKIDKLYGSVNGMTKLVYQA